MHPFCFIDDTLWTGVPGDYTSTNYPSALTQVRNLVDDGKYSEATSAAMSLKGKLPEVKNCGCKCLIHLNFYVLYNLLFRRMIIQVIINPFQIPKYY